MSARKFDKCQMCGGDFTDEHHFSKYCHTCKAKIEYQVEMQKVKKAKEKDIDLRPYDLNSQFIEERYKEISLGITCPECGKQIDANSKMQDWEIKCDNCKLLFTIDIDVKVTRYI